ncbi:MAG: type 2 lanthipeptide synthetase LanM family protein [Candidatus Sulfotelmatobacter sp.]
MQEWIEAVGKGSRDLFEMRLSWDGLDYETARVAIGPTELIETTPLPPWVEILGEYVELLKHPSGGLEHDGNSRNQDQPLPFECLRAPLAQVASMRLRRRVANSIHEISQEALASLEHALVARLASVAQEALLRDFEAMRAPFYSGLSRLFMVSENEDSRELYEQFVAKLRKSGMMDLFQRYPVLARQLATRAMLWIDFAGDMICHSAADRESLEALFNEGKPLGPVIELYGELSDPHNGGRTVTALTFLSGKRLVYKPKSLGAEYEFSRLIEWINARSSLLPLRPLAVLDRADHGWVEFVENRPLRNTEDAKRFYRRAGMLLCLTYVLEATDFHYENVIACGEHPVLVDLETLMHHRGRRLDTGEGAQAQVIAGASLEHSVLRTGLLPRWELTGDDQLAFDVSGLGTEGEQTVSAQVPRWEHINTDRMCVRLETGKLAPRANAPHLENRPVRLTDHTEELLAGFEEMYGLLIKLRPQLLDRDSPLFSLGTKQVRYVFRPTRTYALMQINLTSPQYLRDGVDRTVYIEHLARASTPQDERYGDIPPYWPLLEVEEAAMELGDVPHFTARPDSDAVRLPSGKRIEGAFSEPSLSLVVKRIEAMGDTDRKHQVGLIRASLYANVARAGQGAAETDLDKVSMKDGLPPLTPDEFMARARLIADEIAERAVLASDGSAAWIAPQYLVESERYQLQAIDHSLYGGTSGVALFLAALERVTGGAGKRSLARSALRSLKWAAETSRDVLTEVMGIGGSTGLGSAVYAIVRVSDFLDAPELLDDAWTVARLLEPDLIAKDVLLDVTSGSAGAMLGLLALYQATGAPEALDRAALCGEHLLTKRVASPFGHRSWATHEGKLTTGFSHGAAGISYALLRLSKATGRAEFRDAALEAIAYEDAVYSAENRNWADFREDEQVYVWSWCHGAPGIGLARLGSLRFVSEPRLREDLDVALEATVGFGFRLIDHVCCGNMGRVEVMLAAGRELDRPEWVEEAQALASRVVRRAGQSGDFILNPLLPTQIYNPGFFQGASGIGYELLRLAHPGLLPSVLMME